MYPSFGWIMKNGIASEAAYPYTGQDDACLKKKVLIYVDRFIHFELLQVQAQACLKGVRFSDNATQLPMDILSRKLVVELDT